MIVSILLAAAATAPFAGGERLEYNLTWMGMHVGRMSLAVEDAGEHWRFSLASRTEGSGAKIYPIQEDLFSLVRKSDFQTIYFRKETRRAKKPDKSEETLFDPEWGWYFYGHFRPLGGPCVDTLSFIHLLRLDPASLRAPPRAYDRGKFYRLAFEEAGKQQITVNGLSRLARKVVPRMVSEEGSRKKKGSMTLWFGPAPFNVPLRIDFSIPLGTLKAELVCEP